MESVKVVAFVGMPGSGKGICALHIEQKYGAPIIHFGNMVYEEVQRRGLDNVKDEKFVRKDMRDKEGSEVLAKRVTEKIKQYSDGGAKRITLDGLYSWTEYKYLRNIFGNNLAIIAVAAPRLERYRRVVNRQEAHRKYTIEQVESREIDEIERLEKGGPIAFADYTIVNDEAPEALYGKIDAILKAIGFIS
jgi:dephospho-CoA kinase